MLPRFSALLRCDLALRWFIVLQPILAGLGVYWFLRGEGISRVASSTRRHLARRCEGASGGIVELDARQISPTAGDEDFDTVAHGEPAVEHPKPGEVIWRDDAGVTCRQWNWRQCTRTRITPATTNAAFIIDALAALGPNGLTAAGNDLASSLIRLSPHAAIANRLIAADQPPPAGAHQSC
jgi:hypothetical protein